MEKNRGNSLTSWEITFILIGIMTDIASVSLANDTVTISKQDGWISVIIGMLYPLYIVEIAAYISNKFPNNNIFYLSEFYLGNIVGKIFNFLFLLGFLVMLPITICQFTKIATVYVIGFLKPLSIYVVLIIIITYTVAKDIKVISKINEISFFMLIILILSSIVVLRDGNILNIMPVGGSGIINILRGSLHTAYYYMLIETTLIIYPFMKNKNELKISGIRAVAITCIIYGWSSFICIYYMGIDIIPKTTWSFLTVTESIEIPIINNFRYVFLSIWIFIGIKSIVTICFSIRIMTENLTKHNKVFFIIMYIAVITLILTYYKDNMLLSIITQYSVEIGVSYFLFYVTFMAVEVFIKGNEKIEKK